MLTITDQIENFTHEHESYLCKALRSKNFYDEGSVGSNRKRIRRIIFLNCIIFYVLQLFHVFSILCLLMRCWRGIGCIWNREWFYVIFGVGGQKDLKTINSIDTNGFPRSDNTTFAYFREQERKNLFITSMNYYFMNW